MLEDRVRNRFNNLFFNITVQSTLSEKVDLHFQFVEFFVHFEQRCLIRLYSISGLFTASAQVIKFLSKTLVLLFQALNSLRQFLHILAHMT